MQVLIGTICTRGHSQSLLHPSEMMALHFWGSGRRLALDSSLFTEAFRQPCVIMLEFYMSVLLKKFSSLIFSVNHKPF